MKHNIYADGNFQNIEFTDTDSDKSIGVVEPGAYSFSAERKETVKCITGLLIINGIKCSPGQKTTIAKNEQFAITAKEASSYICFYQ